MSTLDYLPLQVMKVAKILIVNGIITTAGCAFTVLIVSLTELFKAFLKNINYAVNGLIIPRQIAE